MQTEFTVDGANFSRLDQPRVRHCDRMQGPFQRLEPEIQEFVQQGAAYAIPLLLNLAFEVLYPQIGRNSIDVTRIFESPDMFSTAVRAERTGHDGPKTNKTIPICVNARGEFLLRHRAFYQKYAHGGLARRTILPFTE
jgi:hypothetical protein